MSDKRETKKYILKDSSGKYYYVSVDTARKEEPLAVRMDYNLAGKEMVEDLGLEEMTDLDYLFWLIHEERHMTPLSYEKSDAKWYEYREFRELKPVLLEEVVSIYKELLNHHLSVIQEQEEYNVLFLRDTDGVYSLVCLTSRDGCNDFVLTFDEIYKKDEFFNVWFYTTSMIFKSYVEELSEEAINELSAEDIEVMFPEGVESMRKAAEDKLKNPKMQKLSLDEFVDDFRVWASKYFDF